MPIRPFAVALAGAAAPALAEPPAQAAAPAAVNPVPGVRTLESFAAAMGVALGGANDQPVFDAAEAAMKPPLRASM